MRFSDFKQAEARNPETSSNEPAARPKRSHRRAFKVVAAFLVTVLVVGAGGAALAYFVGRPWAASFLANVERDLRTGTADLQLGSDEVRKANQSHDVAALDQAKSHFDSSRRAFASASSRVQREWLLSDAQRVPVVGHRYLAPRLAVVAHLTDMGIALDDAGQDTADVDRPLLARGAQGQSGGQRLITVLTGSGPGLAKINSDLTRAERAAGLVDLTLLPKSQRQPFLKARDQIEKGLSGISEFQRLSPVLLEILGANGPRTYLIEQVDPAELRGGGGFIGSFSLLAADKGNLKLGGSGDVATIDVPYPLPGSRKYVAPPNSSRQFTQHGWVFGDSNFSADFPTNARAGATLFQNETATKVDGVISIDPTAVAALLQVSGPIAVPEYNTTAQAANFVDDVFQRETKLANAVPGKKNFFPAVADGLIEKISNLPTDGWPNLLNALNGSVQGRHLQVYFMNQVAQTEMERISWAGITQVPTSHREVMLEVESNFGGTKANHFLERSYDLTLTRVSGKLEHHLVINLKNSTPDGYEGGRHYTSYLRFYYPASATDAVTDQLTPDQFPSDEKSTGLKLADGWLYMAITSLQLGFATHQVVIDYTTDLGNLALGHDLYWQKQAGTLNDKIHISFQSGGKSYVADSDLAQDRLITLSPQGLQVTPANAAVARLPTLGI